MNDFEKLGLAAPLLRALAEEKYAAPTPIQAGAIPPVLAGRDLVGIAQTGTGKTAAFALPILHRLAGEALKLRPRTCHVLVLSPTRELSGQIADAFRTYGRHLRVSVALAIGGVPIGRQVRSIANGCDILVATPGRLLDLVNSRALSLDGVRALVLDEADRMLDMGFIADIRKVLAHLPKKRQTLFFSATMPKEVAALADQMLNEPAKVAVTPAAATADRVAQRVMHAERQAKPGVLVDLLRKDPGRTIVFTRTKHGADKVVKSLEKAGLSAGAIHGNKSQGQRERALADFRSGRVPVLVATDIAARGIDVDGVGHVVNYDLPNIAESYVHRIGRTARAGASGLATSLVSGEETAFLRDIEKLIRQRIPVEGAPLARSERPAERVARAEPAGGDEPRREGRGRRRGRSGKPQAGRSQDARAQAGRPQGGRPQGGQPEARAKEDGGRNRGGGRGRGKGTGNGRSFSRPPGGGLSALLGAEYSAGGGQGVPVRFGE